MKVKLSLIIICLMLSVPSLFSAEIKKESESKRDKSATIVKDQKIEKIDVNLDQLKIDSKTNITTTNSESIISGNAEEILGFPVFTTTGGSGSSFDFKIKLSIGQSIVGRGTTNDYIFSAGFWELLSQPGFSTCCIGIRGNVDGSFEDPTANPPNNGINISDLVYLVDYSFIPPNGPTPLCDDGDPVYNFYFPEADVNNSGPSITGGIDISDVIYLLNYAFLTPSGPPPYPCPTSK